MCVRPAVLKLLLSPVGPRRDLQKPGDWKLLQALGPRAAVICAPNDM